jgi:TDG/mug DNA glycosylase family protein
MSEVVSFKPIINPKSRVLVLGSMPGAQSITEQKYYANPRNQFWKIIYSVLSTPSEQCYESRLELIQNKGIALWDVIDKCQRIGSLDSNIDKASVNDFESLYSDYPNLKLVVFNGAKAHELYKKQVGFNQSDLVYKLLPSTSPAHTMKYEEKVKQWSVIADYLDLD